MAERRWRFRSEPSIFSPFAALLTIGIGLSPPVFAEMPKTAKEIGLEISPETTVITRPLRPDGFPDYVAYLNETLGRGVERDENFWVLMWQVIGEAKRLEKERETIETALQIRIPETRLLKRLERPEMSSLEDFDQLSALQRRIETAPWSRTDYREAAEWVDANTQALDLLSKAARRPKAFTPLVSTSEPPLSGALLTTIVEFRDAVRVATARAMLRLQEKDFEGSWSDLMTVVLVARHRENGWCLMEYLIGMACRRQATDGLAQWVSRADLTPEQIDARWRELAPLLKVRPVAAVLGHERFMIPDGLLACLSGRAPLEELIGESPALAAFRESNDSRATRAMNQLRRRLDRAATELVFANSNVNTTLRISNQACRELEDAWAPASHRRRAENLETLRNRYSREAAFRGTPGLFFAQSLITHPEKASELAGRVLAAEFVTGVSGAENAQTIAEARVTTLRAVFRLKSYLARGHALPDSLDVIFRDPTENIDPFTEQPLRFRKSEEGVTIYSVGPNGTDDEGKPSSDIDGADDIAAMLWE